MGSGGVNRASSSDSRGSGFEPRPLHLKKCQFFAPKPQRLPEEPGAVHPWQMLNGKHFYISYPHRNFVYQLTVIWMSFRALFLTNYCITQIKRVTLMASSNMVEGYPNPSFEPSTSKYPMLWTLISLSIVAPSLEPQWKPLSNSRDKFGFTLQKTNCTCPQEISMPIF